MGSYCRVFGCPRKLVKHCQYQHFIYLRRNVQNKLERYLMSGVVWLKNCLLFPNLFLLLSDFGSLHLQMFFSAWLIWAAENTWKPLFMDKSIGPRLLTIAYTVDVSVGPVATGVFNVTYMHSPSANICDTKWTAHRRTRRRQRKWGNGKDAQRWLRNWRVHNLLTLTQAWKLWTLEL